MKPFQPRGKFPLPRQKEELGSILPLPEGLKFLLLKKHTRFEKFADIARKNSELAVVVVEKKRFGFSVNGVICEYAAKVWFNGAMVETACCEKRELRKHEDSFGSFRNL